MANTGAMRLVRLLTASVALATGLSLAAGSPVLSGDWLLAFDQDPGRATQKCSQPTKIVLVRHGQTHWNVLGLLQGNADIPLDPTGSAQAQATATAMATKIVAAIYASPLLRAHETALAIAAPHGLPVRKRDDLREIGVGVYTGSQPSQIPSATRAAWAADPDLALPSGIPEATALRDPSYVQGRSFEGESLKAVLDRGWRELLELARGHCGGNVVVVTHGGVIQITLTRVKGLPVTQYRTFTVANASQTILLFHPDGSVALLSDW